MCHDDEDDGARARGLEGANFFGYSLAHYYVFGRHQPGHDRRWAEYQQPPRRSTGSTRDAVAAAGANDDRLGAKVVQGGIGGIRGAVGTPARSASISGATKSAGVDQVIFVLQAGKNRHEHIMESLELFGREVLPEFKERDETRGTRQGAAASSRSSRR